MSGWFFFISTSFILLWCFAEIRLERIKAHAKFTQLFHSELERGQTLSAHLDATDGLLSLHHAHVLRWCLVWQQLRRAQIVCGKNYAVDEVLWVTWAWNWDTRQGSLSWTGDLHKTVNENVTFKHVGGGTFISVCVVYQFTAKLTFHICWEWCNAPPRLPFQEQKKNNSN